MPCHDAKVRTDHVPVTLAASLGRRQFLRSLATMGMGLIAAAGPGRAPAQAQPSPVWPTGGIDVHHHHFPPFYVTENRDRLAAAWGGKLSAAWTSWSVERALEAMDTSGVATGVLSLTSPGVWFGDVQAGRTLARRVNEYATDLARKYPGRFGLFAAVPLPDPEGSLQEIAYALDVLKADGIGLLTSYGDRWLGDPAYAPVFEELDRRKAVVFVHPSVPACCRNLLEQVPPVMVEIPQDTARAITNLLLTGTFARYRGVRFIFTHAGGNLPMIYGRILQYAPKDLTRQAPQGIDAEFQRLYYDVAATEFAPAIAALTRLVPTRQILLGSDNPFNPLEQTVTRLRQLGFSNADLRAIARDNALTLLPRLKTV